MPHSHQREWLVGIIESAPSLLFVLLLRLGVGLELAGWCGVVLAGTVLVGFYLLRLSFNPILLGINIHLLFVTPVVVATFAFGARGLGAVLEAASYKGVLVTIFVVGIVLTLFSSRGFAGLSGASRRAVRRHSLILLAAGVVGIVYAFTTGASQIIAVAVPIIVLFCLRRLLIARWQDAQGRLHGTVPVAGGSLFAADSMVDLD